MTLRIMALIGRGIKLKYNMNLKDLPTPPKLRTVNYGYTNPNVSFIYGIIAGFLSSLFIFLLL